MDMFHLRKLTGFFALSVISFAGFANPQIGNVSGQLVDGGVLTIQGIQFSTKASAKPLLWWKADSGTKTPSNLGRKTTWDDPFRGRFVSTKVAPGSTKSVSYDFGAEQYAPLAAVRFASDKLYVYRKTYEDFDITKNTVYNSTIQGNTFNYKVIRFWNLSDRNNIYVNGKGEQGSNYFRVSEYTGSTLWNITRQAPYKWQAEEVVYKTSGVDQRNGIWNYIRNGQEYSPQPVITRTSARPGRYSTVYQAQVSNGAKSPSIAYYDSLYIDDSWNRVIMCSQPKWSACSDREPQIPTQWSDSTIKVVTNQGGLDFNGSVYLYVVDSAGQANDTGYPLSLLVVSGGGGGGSSAVPPSAPTLSVQ